MKVEKFMVGPISTNCYIIRSGRKVVVLDPGGGMKEVITALKNDQLKYIILTHYHFDHTLGVDELKSKFKEASVVIHEADTGYLEFEVDRKLKEGEEIVFGQEILKVIHTPGHSAGGICLVNKKDIFTGDTLFADDMIGRTDLPGSDSRAMEQSLVKLKKILRPGMHVHPGHGREFMYEEN